MSPATTFRRLSRLTRLSAPELGGFAFALPLVAFTALRLRLHDVGRTLPDTGEPGATYDAAQAIERARFWALAINRAALCVPGASCLVRSIALQSLLRRRGIPAQLQVGVRQPAPDSLDAHAWVTVHGEVVNDAERVADRFAATFQPRRVR